MIATLSLSLSLLPFAWWASAGPITISEVTASREGGHLVVDIAAEAMVDPEAASARVSDGRIFLFVGDTRVRADNRAWGEGADRIQAHRHRREVELVVPNADAGGGACQGPVEFVKAAGGLRAVIGCEGALDGARASARAARPKARAAATEVASAPVMKERAEARKETPPTARRADSAQEARELHAVLGLDEPAREEVAPAQAPQARAQKPTLTNVTAAAAAPVAPPILVALPVADRPAVEKPTPVIPAPAPVVAPATPVMAEVVPHGGAGIGIYLAGALLALLAGAAYVFNRRRVAVPRLVKIVETASLGPKRSIVVARIGNETMILGTSEAGITVLQARPEAAASVAPAQAVVAVAAGAASGDEPDAPEPASPAAMAGEIPDADVDEPLAPVQGGLLARLFRRAHPANESSEFHNFEELLEDSLEDQELRHKLSLGMAGRVP
ncbi:MAG TPA: flagellar biosynthetic protein FliO [Polyangia bacterium]|nr:flagellar biosynthetic protein FliO [Polyangia bacterium]